MALEPLRPGSRATPSQPASFNPDASKPRSLSPRGSAPSPSSAERLAPWLRSRGFESAAPEPPGRADAASWLRFRCPQAPTSEPLSSGVSPLKLRFTTPRGPPVAVRKSLVSSILRKRSEPRQPQPPRAVGPDEPHPRQHVVFSLITSNLLSVGITKRQRPWLRDSHTAPTARFSSASSQRCFPLYSTAMTRPSVSKQTKSG